MRTVIFRDLPASGNVCYLLHSYTVQLNRRVTPKVTPWNFQDLCILKVPEFFVTTVHRYSCRSQTLTVWTSHWEVAPHNPMTNYNFTSAASLESLQMTTYCNSGPKISLHQELQCTLEILQTSVETSHRPLRVRFSTSSSLARLLQSKRVAMKGTKMKHLHKTSSQLFERFGEVRSRWEIISIYCE